MRPFSGKYFSENLHSDCPCKRTIRISHGNRMYPAISWEASTHEKESSVSLKICARATVIFVVVK